MMKIFFNKSFQSLGINIIAESAGTIDREGVVASKYSIAAVAESGDLAIELSKHRSRSIKNLNLSEYTKIYCVDTETYNAVIKHGATKEQAIILNEKNGGIPNPHGKELEDYKECADLIKKEVDRIVGLYAEIT